MRIKQLPPLIANQIAAGEVVERPASVVKELLENSLDAKADIITLEVAYGGLNQIKISDNGVGIVAEDLPLAIAAHATSKINSLNDLYAIRSMGFRGEALASIAAVAKVRISSKPKEQETAMMLSVQDTVYNLSPCARTHGTTVEVEDLFFNAPVRKRFLKSEKLEFQAIESTVKCFALSAPNINLSLKHNGKQVLSLPAATNEQTRLTRISRILGAAFVKEAIYLDVEHGGMKLKGWISGTQFQRSQNDRLWVYINQRMVKDKLINYALKQAYEGILHPGRFPACVLYFTLNCAEVDVNVHPTKHEVRFQQPRLIVDFFSSQLAEALKSKTTSSKESNYSLDYSKDILKSKELYEPYIAFNQKKDEANYYTNEMQWVILNNRYILILLSMQPHIVDIVALQQYRLKLELSKIELPLKNRPLLVPFHYLVPENLACSIEVLSQCLNQFGLSIKCLGKREILIDSIPCCAPYLDLKLFLEGVCSLEEFHTQQLIECMANAQFFDPKLLSYEEKMYFNQLLLQMNNEGSGKMGLFKALTLKDCQDFLDV